MSTDTKGVEAASFPDEVLLTGQVRVLEMVAKGAPLTDILEASLSLCESLSPEMIGSILLLDSQGGLRHGAAPSLPQEFIRAIDGSAIGPLAGSCGTSAFREEPVFVEDIATDPLWADYKNLALTYGLRACWSTPIFDADRKVLGTFAIYYRNPGLPSAWHLRLIGITTNLAAIAISRKRIEDERRQIFERISDAFVALDKDWRYTYLNDKAGQFFGRSPASLIGKHIWTEFSEGRGQPFHLAYEKAMAEQVPIILEEYYPPYDKWFENRIYPSREGLSIYFHDITKRKQSDLKLQESEARFNAFMDASPAISWMVDKAWNLVYLNRSGEAAFRLEHGNWIGKTGFDLLPPEIAVKLRQSDLDAMNAGNPLESIEVIGDQEETRSYWRSIRFPVRSDSGLSLIGGIAVDVTKEKKAEEGLRKLNAELEKRIGERTAEIEAKNRELETFSYSVSHDLKAPLRGIDGYAKILSDEYADKLDEEGRRFLANIRLGSAQMHQLIEDMLAYSRTERRAMSVGALDLKKIVDAILAERQFDLSKVGLTVDVAPGAVLADREGLMMAIRNVLDNAVKFSQKREKPMIEIRSRIEGGRCILSVRDNGTGFQMKHHDTIFQIFQRLHRSEDYAGTGVGLAIVRKALDRMGGSVRAESEPDKGAVFHIDLPCADTEAEAVDTVAETADTDNGTN